MVKYGIELSKLLLECKNDANNNGFCCINSVIHSYYENNKSTVDEKAIHDLDFAYQVYHMVLKDKRFIKLEDKSYTKSTGIHYFVSVNKSYKWEDDKLIIRLIVKPIIATIIGLVLGYLFSRYVFPPNCDSDSENKETQQSL